MNTPNNSTLKEYLLTMQQVADAFNNDLCKINFHNSIDIPRLKGVRLFHSQTCLLNQYVYIAYADKLPPKLSCHKIGSLIIIGKPSEYYYQNQFSTIICPESTNIDILFDKILLLFEHNFEWALKLQASLSNDEELNNLFKLAYEYFENPVFLHDPHFFILSSPVYIDGMTKWEHDEQTGLLRIPISLINDFKVDKEYNETLTTHGSHLFSANQRGYRILYYNLWNEFDSYDGRICINELQSPILPGHYSALEYFAQIVKIALNKQNLNPQKYTRPYITFLTHLIEHTATSKEISRGLSVNSWNPDDEYLCIRIYLQERDYQIRTSIQICHHIEASLHECYAFLYNEDIVVFINLSASGISFSDCTSKLAIITREGLFKTGFSNTYNNFSDTPYYYIQAGIALDYGNRSNSTQWNYYFNQFVMDYIKDKISSELPINQICSYKLIKLKQYDLVNNTEFFDTLKCYLEHERNAVHTANALFIHRSTLFYRLNRIKTMLDLDLDSPKCRLYIQLSYALLEHSVQ